MGRLLWTVEGFVWVKEAYYLLTLARRHHRPRMGWDGWSRLPQRNMWALWQWAKPSCGLIRKLRRVGRSKNASSPIDHQHLDACCVSGIAGRLFTTALLLQSTAYLLHDATNLESKFNIYSGHPRSYLPVAGRHHGETKRRLPHRHARFGLRR